MVIIKAKVTDKRGTTVHESRSTSCRSRAGDRRLREVMAIFDRHVASPLATENGDGFVQHHAEFVIDNMSPDRFTIPMWSVEGCRAVLLANLLHAPAGDFRDMVARARSDLRYLHEAEREQSASKRRKAA